MNRISSLYYNPPFNDLLYSHLQPKIQKTFGQTDQLHLQHHPQLVAVFLVQMNLFTCQENHSILIDDLL